MDQIDFDARERMLREFIEREIGAGELFARLIVTAIVLLILGLFSVAMAHDAMQGMSSEEKRVVQFYSGWNRPDDPDGRGRRHHSCCSMQDCHEVRIKEQGGTVFFLDVWSHPDKPAWRAVSANIVEENQPDPEESPDGKNHACFTPYAVWCFTRGSLI